MSSERLQPGMWCRPSSEREWRAILELADALGVSQTSPPRMEYEEHPCVWADFNMNAAQATDPDSQALWCNFTLTDKVSIPVQEFISRMYAEAEARKAPESEFGAFAPKPGEIGFLKEFIDKLDGMAVRLSMINDKVNHIRLRLEALEEALGEHLCKHRASWL